MARGKQKMTLIQDKIQRKSCYRKRKNSLLKKAEELSILCGVDTCAIVYNPYNGEPEIWPQSYDEVRELISRFENVSEIDKLRKMLSQEGFVKEAIRKTEEQMKKTRNDNRQKETKYLVSQHMKYQWDDKFNLSDLNDLWSNATEKVNQINERLEAIYKGSTTHAPQALLPPTLPTMPAQPPLPLGAIEPEGSMYEPTIESEGSLYGDIQNPYMEAIWAQVQASRLGNFNDRDDAFFLNLLNNDGAGPSFSKP